MGGFDHKPGLRALGGMTQKEKTRLVGFGVSKHERHVRDEGPVH